MNISLLRRLGLVFVLICAASLPGRATPAAPAAAEEQTTAASAAHDDFNDEPESADRHGRLERLERRGRHGRRGDGDIVNIGHDSHLPSGERAGSVVSIFGSSLSEGEAEEVVSVLGNTRVLGAVGESAVAVFGNVYI